jgi:hypothetical protein
MDNHNIELLAGIVGNQAHSAKETKGTIKYLELVKETLEKDKEGMKIEISRLRKVVGERNNREMEIERENETLKEGNKGLEKSYSELRDKLIDMSNKIHNTTVASDLACNSAFGPPTHPQLLAGIDNAVDAFESLKSGIASRDRGIGNWHRQVNKEKAKASKLNAEKLAYMKIVVDAHDACGISASVDKAIDNKYRKYLKGRANKGK